MFERPGRFRSWVVRPLFWGLAALAVLAFSLQLLLDTRWVRDLGRDYLADKLAAYLHRPVSIQEISFEILPLSAELRGFEIGGPDELDPPFLYVPWAAIDADLNTLQNGLLHLRQVRVERPVFYLQFFPDGSNNTPKVKPNRQKRRQRRFEVHIDRLEVDRAELALDQDRIRLSLSTDEIRSRFQGLGDLHIGGQAVAQNVELRLPNARPISVAVAAEGHIERGGLEITSSRISGPGLAARADGTCEWTPGDREARKCLIHARGRATGSALRRLGYFEYLDGALQFDGSYDWRPGASGWRSRIRADQVDLWDRRVEDLEGSLVADQYGVRSVLEGARYAGGTLSGDLSYEHFVEGRPSTVDLDFEDLLFDTLLADQGIPTSGYASRARGSLFYRFPFGNPQKGDGRSEVEVVAAPELPGVALAGGRDLPVRLDIEDGTIRTDSISLQSENQSVLANGWYDLDRRSGAFEYEIASADLPELTPLLPLIDEEDPPLWLPLAGRGELDGTLYLEPEEASTDLRLRFEEVVTSSGATGRASGNLFLDGDGVDSLRLELGGGEEALALRGRMPFEPTAENGTLLVFDAFNWPLTTVDPWLEFELPVAGHISGRLYLHVGPEASDGRLTGTVTPAILDLGAFDEAEAAELIASEAGCDGESIRIDLDSLSGRLAWDRDLIRFHRLNFSAPSGVLEGKGFYSWTEREVDFHLSSPSLEIGAEPLVRYLPRADLRAEVAVAARLSGPVSEPRIELDVETDAIALGERVLEARPSRLALDSENGRWTADGRLLDMVTLSGGGTVGGERADLVFDLEGSDISGLLELLFEEPPADVGGSFRGSLTIAGAGDLAVVDLELFELEIALRDRRLESLEPVAVRLGPEGIEIASFRLGEEATDSEFSLSGRTGYEETSAVDLFLESSMAASWLDLADFGFDLDGTFDLRSRVGGTRQRLVLEGQGELRDGRLALGDFPYPVEELNGVVSLHPERIEIDRLEGRMAGGRVTLGGVVDLTAEELSYRMRAAGEDLRMLYPEGWSVQGDTELTLRSVGDGHLIDGRAELDELEYLQDISFDFADLMRGFLRRQRLEIDPADSLLSVIRLDVEVAATDALRVRNNLATLDGSAELTVRGSLAQPVLYGEVEVEPGGEVVYNSTDYKIERGRLTFANPYQLDPEVDLVLTTEVRDFDILLALSGTLERLDTRFSSQPPLPDLEVFRLLATGDITPQTIDLEPRRADSRLADRRESDSTSAASFLYGQAAAVVGERFNTLFGFDRFRIDPLTGSGDNWSEARFTVGKRISKDFFVTYSVDPSSTEEQRLQIEWQVSPGLVLVLSQNGDNSYSADARWESSF